MERIQTHVAIDDITSPIQRLALPSEHFTTEEQQLLRIITGDNVLLHTNAGWRRFIVVHSDKDHFEFESSGRPAEHA